jgi:CRP/FNR family transcriptional regulator, anaerobic regulatory protein
MKESAIDSAWKGFSRCESCAMREAALFGDLTPEDFTLIHMPIDEVELAVGMTLYSSGDEGQAIFTLRTGLIKLVQFLADGQQRIVRLVMPGDVLGLETLAGRPYAHTAIILEKASFCRIPRPVIERLERETPRLHGNLTKRWFSALEQADAWLTELSTGKAPQRFARLLLRIMEQDGRAALFTREDLGAMLAITTEHASRVVAEFRRNNVISEVTPNSCRANRHKLECIAASEC